MTKVFRIVAVFASLIVCFACDDRSDSNNGDEQVFRACYRAFATTLEVPTSQFM